LVVERSGILFVPRDSFSVDPFSNSLPLLQFQFGLWVPNID